MTDLSGPASPGASGRRHKDSGAVEPKAAVEPKGAVEPKAPDAAAPDREMLLACVELLFFAYRDFTGDPDAVLDEFGFGRAHHRVLHFISRNPGLTVADLLDILRITKQSLARVLRQLISEGFVAQRAGELDRRERRLYLTAKGGRLAERLATLQTRRIEAALREAGPVAGDAARRFLFAMIADAHRPKVEALIRLPRGATTGSGAAQAGNKSE